MRERMSYVDILTEVKVLDALFLGPQLHVLTGAGVEKGS